MSSPFHSVRSDHAGALRAADSLHDLRVEHYEGSVDAIHLRTAQQWAKLEVIQPVADEVWA
jgi:hypothetical protein